MQNKIDLYKERMKLLEVELTKIQLKHAYKLKYVMDKDDLIDKINVFTYMFDEVYK